MTTALLDRLLATATSTKPATTAGASSTDREGLTTAQRGATPDADMGAMLNAN